MHIWHKVQSCPAITWYNTGLHVSKNFHLPNFQNLTFFHTDYKWFRRKRYHLPTGKPTCLTGSFTCPGLLGKEICWVLHGTQWYEENYNDIGQILKLQKTCSSVSVSYGSILWKPSMLQVDHTAPEVNLSTGMPFYMVDPKLNWSW